MPIYEYVCQNENCGKINEVIHKVSGSGPESCEYCACPELVRKTSVPSFHLKGGGWYKDGYGNENGGKKDASVTDSPKTEKKPTDPEPKKSESTKSTADKPTPKSSSAESKPSKTAT